MTDLSRSDFAVFEDGVQQQVSFFESSLVPVDLILMLDTSSSMSDKIATVHEAAINFLRTLRAGDRGAVVSFADHVQILEKLSGDRGKLEAAVNQTGARGGTALNDALYVALREFGGATREDAPLRRRAIALLTDGEDTSSVVNFDDVVALARKAGINIYTIALQSPARGDRRVRATLPDDIAVLAEVAGAGDRRRGLLPRGSHRAARRLWLDRTGALEPVLDRLHALQLPRRRPVPANCRARCLPPGNAAEGPRRLHG